MLDLTAAQLSALIKGHQKADEDRRKASMAAVRTAVWAEPDDFKKAMGDEDRRGLDAALQHFKEHEADDNA